MADIASLGIVVTTRGAREAARDLDRLSKESAESERRASRLGKAWGAALGVGVAGAAVVGVAALKKYIVNTIEAERVQSQLAARIRSTGAAAGLALGDLNNMADALQRATTFDDEAIGEAQAMLLTFTRIGRETFPRATEAVLDMSTALGTDLKSAALQVGKALNDPVAGLTALSRAGVQFTDDQKDLIRGMVDTGRTADAQAVILRELETQMGGSARAARDTLGGAVQALKNSFDNLLEGDAKGGGLIETRQAIESLNTTLNDPAIKRGVDTIAGGIFEILNAAVAAIPQLVEFNRQLEVGLGLQANANGKRRGHIGDVFAGLAGGARALASGDLAAGIGADRRIWAGVTGGELPDFSNVQGSPDFSNVVGSSRTVQQAKATAAAVKDVATSVGHSTAATRDNTQALRENILASTDFDRQMVELEAETLEWSASLQELNAQLAGPEAEALLAYNRNLAEVEAAHQRGAISTADLAKWQAALGEEFKRTTQTMVEQVEAIDESAIFWEDARFAAEDTLASILDGSKSARDAVDDLGDAITRMASQAVARNIMGALFGTSAYGGAEAGGSLIDLFSGSGFGFASGGYTGAGPRNRVAGVVHAGEYVLNADAVRKLPRDYLDAMNNGRMPGGGVQLQQTFIVQGTPDSSTREQMARASGREARRGMARTGG